MIAFDVERDGVVQLRYRRLRVWYAVAALSLLLSLAYCPRGRREMSPSE